MKARRLQQQDDIVFEVIENFQEIIWSKIALKGGPGEEVGLKRGDLILAIKKQPVSGVDSFVSMVNSLPRHQKVVFLALDHRSGNTSYMQVEVN
jgi:C-terminal processing protease CtpA/Prc